ncbi:MAG: translation initiation factor IF-2 [Bacteroidales bacterium]|nr:translation initiation factor IF-2 [Bacteroidales bacterium]
MSAEKDKVIRLNKVAKELNVGIHTIVEYLAKKGKKIDESPNTKIDSATYELLSKAFLSEKKQKEASKITPHKVKPTQIVVEAEEIVKKEKESREEDEKIPNEIVIRDVTLGGEIEKTKEEPISQQKSADKEEVVEEKKEVKVKEEPVVKKEEKIVEQETSEETVAEESETTNVGGLNILGKIDLNSINPKTKPTKKKKDKKEKKVKDKKEEALVKPNVKQEKPNKPIAAKPAVEVKQEEVKKEKPAPAEPEFISTSYVKLTGPILTGEKVDLSQFNKPKKQQPVASSSKGKIENKEKQDKNKDKKKRKRIQATPAQPTQNAQPAQPVSKKENKKHKPNKKEVKKVELDSNEIEKQIKETLARLSPMGKSKTSKHRRDKRQSISQHMQEEILQEMEQQKILKVTEFVTANELANMMDVPVTKIIASCMSLGMFVSINQRLDAEAIQLIADEFGYSIKFVSADVVEALSEEEEVDREEDMQPRSPIVTVMGHVDHGKTSLLDYIRNANVIAGEAGGITQHIGAYEVSLPESGKKITFLDTPGHEAFTAMRARGAKMTDIAIIVIACDDKIMPQTIEAINHAQAAGVPIVFALNKIDRPAADPDRIKSELANMNLLVEDWGGKIQSQEISAKKGTNVDLLLEKVLLEAEMLELKGNPNKRAKGTVIESSLDKGRGYVAKILVQDGTIRQGDVVLAGATYGRVKAMYNERNKLLKEAGPSAPVLLLGLNGAPQAGDTFNVMQSEKDAKDLSNKRTQLQREQGLRTQKHITLDEIGRRIAIGDFKQLDLIVKADVDGSVEALSDSLLKLSTPEVQVNVIHKSVGQITESDVLLATASNAIIIGFQVRPSVGARKLAEQEQIDIRLYSIIYTAINELKDAIEGMLSPEIQEKIVANLEVRETFKISKVGTIAGCMCLDGKIARSTKVRIIRDGIVVYTGKLASLKRFKDDVKEVVMGQDCGLNIENFNDIKVGDIIEGYEELEIKRTLK